MYNSIINSSLVLDFTNTEYEYMFNTVKLINDEEIISSFFEEYSPDDYNFLVIITDDIIFSSEFKNYKKIFTYSSGELHKLIDEYPCLFDTIFGTSFPTCIKDNIYIGNSFVAENSILLDSMEFDIVINMTPNVSFGLDDIDNYRFPIDDSESENIQDCLNDTYQIIVQNMDKKILVHCHKGQSRSGSVIVYFMCKYLKINVDTSLKLIKSYYPLIRPNPGFIKQLIHLVN